MKRIAVLTLAGLVVLALVWLLRGQRPERLHDNASGGFDAATGPVASTRAPASAQGEGPGAATATAASRDAIRVGDGFYGSQSQADVDWLNRNAFPSESAMSSAGAHHAALSAADFTLPFTPRSLAAAERAAMVRPDLAALAKAHLHRAAVAGSIYALQALAQVYAYPSTRNDVLSEAYYFAAEMRGNWALAAWPRRQLHAEDAILAKFMGHQIVQNIQAERAKRGLPPLRLEQRPGLDDAMRALRATRT